MTAPTDYSQINKVAAETARLRAALVDLLEANRTLASLSLHDQGRNAAIARQEVVERAAREVLALSSQNLGGARE